MEVEFVTDGLSEDESFQIGENGNDSAFEGESCGICMDAIIDRGVLDCCQHWFCFDCIDNWATITNLCPLCQNEFQFITCVPVYDSVGGNKVDEDSFSSLCRDDGWCIDGKNNTLSFPSYYIDENAVTCLDGDGCKIQNGSAAMEEDSNLDTSIACDSCDIWYHAFCVGFDVDSTSENTWLCPRCAVTHLPQKSDATHHFDNRFLTENSFSGKVSISIADAGETAVVVSMIEGNEYEEKSNKDFLGTKLAVNDSVIQALVQDSYTSSPDVETSLNGKTENEEQEPELSLSHDISSISDPLGHSEWNNNGSDKAINGQTCLDGVDTTSSKMFGESEKSENDSSFGLHLGLSVGSFSTVGTEINKIEVPVSMGIQQGDFSDKSHISGNTNDNVLDADHGLLGDTGVKRKHTDNCCDDDCLNLGDEKTKEKTGSAISAKRFRTGEQIQMVFSNDQSGAGNSISESLQEGTSAEMLSKDNLRNSEDEHVSCDIMSIVQSTGLRRLKKSSRLNHVTKSLEEKDEASGVRVKKIMRRATEDTESSRLVQKLRKEIKEATGSRSSEDFGKKLLDPKLLAAFRAAVSGSMVESTKKPSPLVVKTKKSILQKGGPRENLTKKIYGMSNGRRKRAWDRDCEIEFWKHRCMRTPRLQKIETLKSVLDLLKKSSDNAETDHGCEPAAENHILSRLYLADASVLPRKADIRPLSALTSSDKPNEEQQFSVGKSVGLSPENQTVKPPDISTASSRVGLLSFDCKGNENDGQRSKSATSFKVRKDECQEEAPNSQFGGSISKPQKEVTVSDDIRSDKRKWALKFLARKTAAAIGKETPNKQEDNAQLKRSYPLLAQLPNDMRPVPTPINHSKIPMSVRQTQLYLMAEHFLRTVKLPDIRRTAETELAVADAVNIEKEIANRSNSKLVYVNLCSQERLLRSDNRAPTAAAESNPSPSSALSTAGLKPSITEFSSDPAVEAALRTAGLLSDSPPDSPVDEMKGIGDEGEGKVGEEGPSNIIETESHPELDNCGVSKYDLESEDYISKIQTDEGESRGKVVISTLASDRSDNPGISEKCEKPSNAEVSMKDSLSLKCGPDIDSKNMVKESGTDSSCCSRQPVFTGGVEGPSAECEELYGPDKEPLIEKLPEGSGKQYAPEGSDKSGINIVMELNEADNHGLNQVVGQPKLGKESNTENQLPATVSKNSAGCRSFSKHSSQTDKDVQMKGYSDLDTAKRGNSSNSVTKKVEAYIKEHIRPLCRSGVITTEQYRWAVEKTTEKVMKYHSKDKNANFLIKEGEKVKKLAGQYVEAAQKKEHPHKEKK